ncbi:DeoR/GlpR family DNA-binding transcription regulator [Solicola sp. PLA-1-18]|uniref:DeoR/GlpR family DNA-binding transcription regulator n=1 Tax=Solicola sp. PLA-1-18 TaxID=3380532 RepID=UPI003B771E75
MFATERRRLIVDLVRTSGAISIRDLADQVSTSEVTVRRDLQKLADEGVLERRHGGAVAVGEQRHEPSYAEKTTVAAAEKRAIARRAAERVRDGEAIVLGAGTTTMALAQELRDRQDLTVMTNSVLVAQVFADCPQIDVVLTGGMLRGSIFALVGSVAERSLDGMHADHTFLSGNGLTADKGLSTPNQMVAGIDRALAAAGREVVVLADHTKVGVNSVVQTVPASRIDHLVTDPAADPDVLAALAGLGIVVTTT